jgi:hypothetical protein
LDFVASVSNRVGKQSIGADEDASKSKRKDLHDGMFVQEISVEEKKLRLDLW